MKRFLTGAAVLGVLAGPTLAQTPAPADPVIQNYRAYDAALGRSDLPAAEAAAAAALAASEARDGDGGSTARLAANLAQVRLDQGRGADALAPAQRALAIVEARGAQAGVDSFYARLLVGRAELAAQGPSGELRLRTALGEAESAHRQRVEAYDAAIDLGEWGLGQGRPDVARDAFQIAADLSSGQSEIDVLARAQAELGRGIALSMLDRPAPRVASGSRLLQRPNTGAEEALRTAMELTRPYAERDARRGAVTRAQMTYSSALAWAHARAALLAALGWQSPLAPTRGMIVDLNEGDGVPACPAEYGGGDAPGVGAIVARTVSGEGGAIVDARYVGAMDRFDASAFGYATSLIARITTDASGAVTDARVVGSVDNLSLDSVLGSVLESARRDVAASGCSRARVMFAPVVFLIDGAALQNPALRTALMVAAPRTTSGVGLTPN